MSEKDPVVEALQHLGTQISSALEAKEQQGRIIAMQEHMAMDMAELKKDVRTMTDKISSLTMKIALLFGGLTVIGTIFTVFGVKLWDAIYHP